MNFGVSVSLKVSRSGVEVMVLVFIHVAFFTSRRLYSFLVPAIVLNIRYVIVVDVDQAVALVDFVASEYFNFNLFLESWRT